ncbi:hypothetical protein MY4038_008224, partial [Beauveria bassiana]
MYKPAPPRPKKTNITRTRTGCLECRARRCDEKKPMCGRFVRKGDMLSIRSSPLFVDIMAAVSASHLSRTSPQRRLLMGPGMREQNFRPNTGHESVSQEIYGSVMKKMARWSVQDFGAHPILGLAVITVFCLIESAMGSFQAFGLHYDGAISLIKDLGLAARGIAQRGQACTLLATLVEIRMQMWWRRVYFGTRDFHRNRPKVSLDPVFSHVSGFESRRASILSILCESHRINNAAIIAHWDLYCHADSGSLLGDDTTGSLQQMIEPFAQKIRYEKDRLDAWDLLFSLSGRVEDTDMLHATAATLKVRPLHMPSHTEAMDYAYYIASRVLQCPGPLYSLYTQRSEEMRKRYTEVESWIHLLLRVVAGMDWQDCV